MQFTQQAGCDAGMPLGRSRAPTTPPVVVLAQHRPALLAALPDPAGACCSVACCRLGAPHSAPLWRQLSTAGSVVGAQGYNAHRSREGEWCPANQVGSRTLPPPAPSYQPYVCFTCLLGPPFHIFTTPAWALPDLASFLAIVVEVLRLGLYSSPVVGSPLSCTLALFTRPGTLQPRVQHARLGPFTCSSGVVEQGRAGYVCWGHLFNRLLWLPVQGRCSQGAEHDPPCLECFVSFLAVRVKGLMAGQAPSWRW
ncbi:hypothetical protein HaLaN_27869 [Haematococcus lacustris]|uniref:Uncharacterized protein n=1 Tax=Haematococcus lacustris TaxID=44745 RepID=A0A6A0A9D7_HAELA|nr:hypothetical protein HaLaN_27869 [Haematococcus lacustris]